MNTRDIQIVMTRSILIALFGPAAVSAEPMIAPLLEGMGTHQHEVTTDDSRAQRYFDQGLVLSFGFNHKEAARSFRQAQALDPECGMCFWGEALVLGPNINAGMDASDNPRAYAAVRQALALQDQVSARERAYIQALAKRYTKEAPADRSELDRNYATAMGEVGDRFPDDPDAAALYAEALMDTTPWDYWQQDGSPKPITQRILSTLESVLADNPDHPLANHLYIHAVEKVHPRRGVAAADRLRDLVPGAAWLARLGRTRHPPLRRPFGDRDLARWGADRRGVGPALSVPGGSGASRRDDHRGAADLAGVTPDGVGQGP